MMADTIVPFPVRSAHLESPARARSGARSAEAKAEAYRKAGITRQCSREVNRLWELALYAREMELQAQALRRRVVEAIHDISTYLREAQKQLHDSRSPLA